MGPCARLGAHRPWARAALALRLLLVVLLAGCASAPPASDHQAATDQHTTEPQQSDRPSGDSQPERAEQRAETASATTDPDQQQAADKPDGPKEPLDIGQFVASEELYEQTFSEIAQLISHLNGIIGDRNYDAWREFLTDEYRAQASSPEYLAELEKQGPLARRNIRLRGMPDFFRHIVVPSRSNAVLDHIEFVDENHVKAVSMTSRGPGVLYYLVRSEDGWKIGVF